MWTQWQDFSCRFVAILFGLDSASIASLGFVDGKFFASYYCVRFFSDLNDCEPVFCVYLLYVVKRWVFLFRCILMRDNIQSPF